MAYLRFLDQVSAQDTALAGGKGANLGELARAGFPVPPGFVLTTAAYRAFVETNNLQEIIGDAIQATDPEDPTELERAATTIASHFIAARMPAEIADELCRAYRTLGQGPVAVRSSATAEDLPEASFAGQQETLLNVIGEEAVLEAVRRCWASLWTARAIAYRAKRAIPSGGVALAVVVQRMVAAEMAGVLFTANPANRDPDEMVVNASRGLGEAVVSGQVTPEEIVVNRRRWKVRRCSSEDWRTVHWRQISPFTLPAPVTWMTTSPGTATSSTTSTSPSRWQGRTGQHWRRCGEPGWKAPPRPTSGTPNWRRSGKRRPGASGNACRTGNVASLTRHWRRHNARRNFVRTRSSTWGWRGCHCANTRWNSGGGWSRPGR